MNNKKGIIFDLCGIFVQDPWEWMLYRSSNSIAIQFDLSKDDVKKAGHAAWKDCDTKNHPGSLQTQERTFWEHFLLNISQVPNDLTVDLLMSKTKTYIQPLHNDLYKGLLNCVKSQNIPMAICSNSTEFWFYHEWEALGIQEYFNKKNIILSHKIGATKNSENNEMFYAVKDSLEIPLQQLVFIDDRKHNIEIAQSLGITGIFVPDQSISSFHFVKSQLKEHFEI